MRFNVMLPAGLIAAILCFASAAHATIIYPSLGQAGPSNLDLGVFVTGPTTINASNSGTNFDTNMGLANGSSTNFSGGGTLVGKLYADPGATIQSNIGSQFNIDGGIVTQSLSQAVTDVQNAAAAAAALSANQTFTNIGGSPLTIFSSGPSNVLGGKTTVVGITSIAINNPSDDLTISGGADDYFILNVAQTISVTNGEITATGGIPASHILFNVEGTGNSVSLSNSTSLLTGTYLAPNSGQKITLSPGTVDGAVIGYQIQTSSGPTVNGSVYNYLPSYNPVPEPSSIALLGIGAIGFACMTCRKLRRRAA